MAGFLCFLVIDTHNIISAGSCKITSVWRIVHCEDLIISLDAMPELLAWLCEELEEMPVCIGCEYCCSDWICFFWDGSPPEDIDWGIGVGLFVLDVGIDVYDFWAFEEVVDADVAISCSDGCECVFVCKSGDHDFAFIFDSVFDDKFLFELSSFDDSGWI